jgi:hypothetical protein
MQSEQGFAAGRQGCNEPENLTYYRERQTEAVDDDRMAGCFLEGGGWIRFEGSGVTVQTTTTPAPSHRGQKLRA